MKIIFLKIFIILIFSNLISCDFIFQQRTQKFKDENISGIVTKKYIDKWNHYHKSIILNNSYDLGIEIWENDSIDLWSYINIGDSIIKPKGSFILTIIKSNGINVNFNYTE